MQTLQFTAMRNLVILLLISQIFISCRSKSVNKQIEEKKYYYVRYGLNEFEKSGDTIQIYYQLQNHSNYYTLTYSSIYDTSTYNVSKDIKYQPAFSQQENEQNVFAFTGDTTSLLDNRIDTVYKYSLNETTIDGGSLHYWSPRHGIFLVHSTTWPTIVILQTNDTMENREILQMIKNVCPKPNFYFRGQLETLMNKL